MPKGNAEDRSETPLQTGPLLKPVTYKMIMTH